MIASSVCTARAGNAPAAVSPASMIASTPSSTALAASLTSARVGLGSVVIDSSTCVATMTGMPRRRARRVMSFCAVGTRSSGISRPRSPRATITPSHDARISSSWSSACGRSSFATSGTAGAPAAAISSRARVRSAAVCTKLSATISTPSDSPACRSATSFGVTADAASGTPGALMPLCSPSAPALHDRRLDLAPSVDSTRSSMKPSASSSRSPGLTRARGPRTRSRCGRARLARCPSQCEAASPPRAESASRLRACPSESWDRRDPGGSQPGALRRAAARRMRWNVCAWLSRVPCE